MKSAQQNDARRKPPIIVETPIAEIPADAAVRATGILPGSAGRFAGAGFR
jgi:hypothetical protein